MEKTAFQNGNVEIRQENSLQPPKLVRAPDFHFGNIQDLAQFGFPQPLPIADATILKKATRLAGISSHPFSFDDREIYHGPSTINSRSGVCRDKSIQLRKRVID